MSRYGHVPAKPPGRSGAAHGAARRDPRRRGSVRSSRGSPASTDRRGARSASAGRAPRATTNSRVARSPPRPGVCGRGASTSGAGSVPRPAGAPPTPPDGGGSPVDATLLADREHLRFGPHVGSDAASLRLALEDPRTVDPCPVLSTFIASMRRAPPAWLACPSARPPRGRSPRAVARQKKLRVSWGPASARAGTRFPAFGVPRPVKGSQPVPAE